MRKTRIALAALGPAALLAGWLAGCAMPPYSEELSLAQITRAKLGTPVFKVGPVYSRLDDSASRDRYYFLPNRDDPLSYGGFLIRESDYGLWLWFVAPYSSYSDLGSNRFFTMPNAGESSNNYLLQPIEANTGTSFLTLTRFAPAYNDVVLISATGPSTVAQGVARSLPTELGLTHTLGANIFADSTSNISDPQFFLGSLGTGSYREYVCETDSSSAFSFLRDSATSDLGLVPDDVQNAFYAHNPNSYRSYLSLPSGSSYTTYSWTWDDATDGAAPSGFQQLAGVKGRVEAVLNNGQFLTTFDNSCALYSPEGGKLNEFPLGGLKLCYERYDSLDGLFKVYFSLAYWLWGRDEKSDQLYVELYAIPTDSLAGLK